MGIGPGSEAGPVRAPVLRERPGRLPVELTSFVGRDQELAEVRRLMSLARLVTLTGPGGVGKTRLALRAATGLQRSFRDGVWLVELAELEDAGGVERLLLRALGALELSDAPYAEQLVEFLADREVLVVLDNCEHLVEAVARVVAGVMRYCPGLKILATSREPLKVSGEQQLPVAPLAEAVLLFADRAASAAPGFELTDANREAVERIVAQLDGLPLAIELAAARLRTISAVELADRLSDRYRLLTRGSRTAPDRHQTLRLCVDWSYRQCSPEEQLLWDRLSVFVGGFEIDAVEGVVAFGELAVEEVLDLLSSLVAKSIVTRLDTPDRARFRLLETMRDYGRERLVESDELDETVARHRAWFTDLVTDAYAATIGPDQGAWWSRLDREQANVTAALAETHRSSASSALDRAESRLCVLVNALLPYWAARASFTEARQWIAQAVASTSNDASLNLVRLLVRGATFAAIQEDQDTASRLLERATDAARDLDDDLDDRAGALVAYAIGFARVLSGDLTGAVAPLTAAAESQRADGDVLHLVMAQTLLVTSLGLSGRLTEATAVYSQATGLLEPAGEKYFRGNLMRDLAQGHAIQGNLDTARELLHRSMRLSTDIGDRASFVYSLHTLALCEWAAGNHERATVLAGSADGYSRDLGATQRRFGQIAAVHRAREEAGRQALGDRRYDSAYQDGTRLDFASLVSYALEEDVAPATLAGTTPSVLTQRELEIAEYVAEGLTNAQIATGLFITPRTVRGHIENIMTKLGMNTRSQIAAWYADPRNAPKPSA